MSQLLVVFYNNSSIPVNFINTEHSGDNQTVPAGEMFRTDKHFNIPDDGDLNKDNFSNHHMEIQDTSGNSIFSFWDNPGSQGPTYQLMFCNGTDWADSTNTMPGYYTGGNFANVGIVLSGGPQGGYFVQACQVMNDV